MRKTVKIALAVICLVLVAALVAGFVNRDRLVRLHRVNTLFDEGRIVGNFSAMDQLFDSLPLPKAANSTPLPEAPGSLPETFRFEGEARRLNAFLAESDTTSLLVLHDDRIVSETYYLDTGPDDRRISWSMAKSFLSALIGIAIDEGAIADIDDPVTKYVPALAQSAYDGVPIRHVLNMASGVRFDEDYLDFFSDINRMGRVLALGQSMDDFALTIDEHVRPSGEARQYTSIDTHVLAMVLRAATGKSLPELMSAKILSKIGLAADGYYSADGHGIAFALGGLNLTTRDYARFGQLLLDEGKWKSVQVVPAEWARRSVEPTAPASAVDEDKFGYGYQWWIPPQADGEFFAVGIYSQYIYVNRKAGTVIVKTSAHRGFRDDGESGFRIKREHMAAFRAIAEHLSAWRHTDAGG